MFKLISDKKQKRIGRAIAVCHAIAESHISDENVKNDLHQMLACVVADIGGGKNNIVATSVLNTIKRGLNNPEVNEEG